MDDAAALEQERGDPLRSAFTAEIEALIAQIRELNAEILATPRKPGRKPTGMRGE